MTSIPAQSLQQLSIDPALKTRRGGPGAIYAVIGLLVALCALAYLGTRERADQPAAAGGKSAPPPDTNAPPASTLPADTVLTVSGYVIPRERIEISPRFQATVQAIHVKKGDVVKKDTVLVELEADEFRARLAEAEGRYALARANLANAQRELTRQQQLASNKVDSVSNLDRARWTFESAEAEVQMASGQLDLARTYLSWCTIRAPIDGTVLEKLVSPNELVTPQSFGGNRGPSTAFLAMADLTDLQVELDINESDTPKVRLGQRCRVSPEAYPDKRYEGTVAEIAPEANRSKGTLQVKVQVKDPDRFLTPELSARVDFLKE